MKIIDNLELKVWQGLDCVPLRCKFLDNVKQSCTLHSFTSGDYITLHYVTLHYITLHYITLLHYCRRENHFWSQRCIFA